MKTAVKPAVSSSATGTSATSSRFRALDLTAASGPSSPGALTALDVLDQGDRVVARAELVPGHRVLALRWQRARLNRACVALLVQADAEGQVVWQAAIQRHAA